MILHRSCGALRKVDVDRSTEAPRSQNRRDRRMDSKCCPIQGVSRNETHLLRKPNGGSIRFFGRQSAPIPPSCADRQSQGDEARGGDEDETPKKPTAARTFRGPETLGGGRGKNKPDRAEVQSRSDRSHVRREDGISFVGPRPRPDPLWFLLPGVPAADSVGLDPLPHRRYA